MDRARTALVLIDLQNCYLTDEPLASARDGLVDRCRSLIDGARGADVPVISVQTRHRRDRTTWTLNMLDDDQGFAFAGDADARVIDELDIDDATPVFKTRDNAFTSTDLEDILREGRVGRLVVAGVSTHSCVAATATEAYARNLRVTLVADAIASHRPELHEPVLAILRDEYRQSIVTAAEFDWDSVRPDHRMTP